jgi:hypothetical protein
VEEDVVGHRVALLLPRGFASGPLRSRLRLARGGGTNRVKLPFWPFFAAQKLEERLANKILFLNVLYDFETRRKFVIENVAEVFLFAKKIRT